MKTMTTTEAAKQLQCSPRWIRKLCEHGHLGVKVGRDWVIHEEEVKSLQKQREEKACKN